jgi:hypothetical protein
MNAPLQLLEGVQTNRTCECSSMSQQSNTRHELCFCPWVVLMVHHARTLRLQLDHNLSQQQCQQPCQPQVRPLSHQVRAYDLTSECTKNTCTCAVSSYVSVPLRLHRAGRRPRQRAVAEASCFPVYVRSTWVNRVLSYECMSILDVLQQLNCASLFRVVRQLAFVPQTHYAEGSTHRTTIVLLVALTFASCSSTSFMRTLRRLDVYTCCVCHLLLAAFSSPATC